MARRVKSVPELLRLALTDLSPHERRLRRFYQYPENRGKPRSAARGHPEGRREHRLREERAREAQRPTERERARELRFVRLQARRGGVDYASAKREWDTFTLRQQEGLMSSVHGARAARDHNNKDSRWSWAEYLEDMEFDHEDIDDWWSYYGDV